MGDLDSSRRPIEPPVLFPEPLRPLTPIGIDDTVKILKEILVRLGRIEERLANIEKVLMAKSR